MQPDPKFKALETRVFKLFRRESKNGEENHSFEGTGFLLSEKYMLTCEHVSKRGGNLIADPNGYRELTCVSSCGDLDVALLQLPKDFVSTEVRPIPLASGVLWKVSQFPSDECCLFGGSEMAPTEGISLQSIALSSGKGLQFIGSGMEGNSGGPLVLTEFPEIAIFGIGVLGGEKSLPTRATSSDLLIDWLNKQKKDSNLKELNFQTISFEDVLKKIVFGDSDWTLPLQDQWFGTWAYARNPAGEYVSAESNGLEPVRITECAVKVFDSNTAETICSQGINTGSTLYAELFDKYPERFRQDGDDA